MESSTVHPPPTAAGWNLTPLFPYAFLSGAVAVEVGMRIIALRLTQEPILSGAGFIVTGLGGMLLPWRGFRGNGTRRRLVATALAAGAAIWLYTGVNAYWGHMESFAKWTPATMRGGAARP